MLVLKVLRKIYSKIFIKEKELPKCIRDPEIASELIYNTIVSNKPIMIARFGAFELATITNYLGILNQNKSLIKYIKGEQFDWTWNKRTIKFLNTNAGFFPPTKENISQFCELMIDDSRQVDILGSWIEDEKLMTEYMNDTKIHLRFLEPFWSEIPWTKALKGKKVLVVHPFSKTILKQYENRELLFNNKNILPEFKSLTVIKAVQSLGGNNDQFEDWFQALDFMKSEIDKVDYDICLIGAGAYGFPLAAHVKRQGKKAIHMGGALQLLFGICGKRWEDPEYGVRQWGIPRGFYSNMMNEYWVHPNEDETPTTAYKVECACYW